MNAELLAIGTELTTGQTVNTNAAFLGRQLAAAGIRCARQTAVPDDWPAMIDAIRQSLARADVLLITGGLGPTADDRTVEAIAAASGCPLREAPDVARRIRAFYRLHGRRLNRLALRQARLPTGATALPNPIGTAPGIWLPLRRSILIAMPGVPREMRAMMERSVLPRLLRLPGRSPTTTRTLRTVGVIELQIQDVLKRIGLPACVDFGLYPHLMSVDVRLTVSGEPPRRARAILDRLERALRQRLGDVVFGRDDETLESVVGRAFANRGLTIATAESCTGGLVANRITDVAGSSRYFLLSTVAYHNRMKQQLLGVPERALDAHGAVSAPVARMMAVGVRRLAGADIGLSLTGIAGPGGGSARKPVGLVYMAIADERGTTTRRCQFRGDREAVKHQAAQIALNWLRARVERLPRRRPSRAKRRA